MLKFGLIGNPIAHSKSPALFKAAYSSTEMEYSLIEGESVEIAIKKFLDGPYRGINVTSPFKDKVMEYVTNPDRITSLLGSANVLVKSGDPSKRGELLSYNTDYYGVLNTVRELLLKKEVLPENIRKNGIRRVIVVGAGGAGKAAALAMCDAGYKVFLANRSAGKVEEYAKKIGAEYIPLDSLCQYAESADMIIYSLSFLLEQLKEVDLSEKIIFEANYANASLSPDKGIVSGLYIDGRHWLFHQAVPAFLIFTGVEPNELEMRKIVGIE